MTKIKICGITSLNDIEYINQTKPDYIGFVFTKSKRQIDFNKAFILKSQLDKNIQAVGVFVNENIDLIKKLCENNVIDIIQLHGDEDEEYINSLKKLVSNPIIRAVKVKDRIDKIYNDVDYVLFDTYHKAEYGGTGESFDWNKINGYEKPFFLAGGLNQNNIIDAINLTHPFCVDVSSGVETNGFKDKQKIIDIVKLVRSVK